MADEVERPTVAVEPEQKGGNLLPAGAISDDHAIDGAVILDLRHGVAGSGLVGKANALGDDAVEADHLEPLEPLLRELGILRHRREREALRETLELLAALRERALVDRLAVPEKNVEHDVARRRLSGQLSNARLGGVKAILHRVELELAVKLDDDLAVEGRMRR